MMLIFGIFVLGMAVLMGWGVREAVNRYDPIAAMIFGATSCSLLVLVVAMATGA